MRYHERLGVLTPVRGENGYREYREADARVVEVVRSLGRLGIPVQQTRPRRCAPRPNDKRRGQSVVTDYMSLPSDLPVPEDDGAADHLAGLAMPPITLPGTAGSRVALDDLGPGRTVLYIYPLSGRPGVDLPDGWDAIPGARGCTPEACGFRDHHAELRAAGAAAVFGLSSQSTDYQSELGERLDLPFEILSDPDLEVADALRLPTFTADDRRLYKRLTLVVTDGRIEHAFYPIFPPDQHAAEVLQWLRDHAGGQA